MHVFSWLPGAAMVARADVVLFHGGYGTMMETIRAGVPSVLLPFHTEQEGNGRRLEQNGAAQVLAPVDDDLIPCKPVGWGGSLRPSLSPMVAPTASVADRRCRRLSDPRYQTKPAVSVTPRPPTRCPHWHQNDH
jgi:hypothetical protein